MNPYDDDAWLAAQFAGEALLSNPPKGAEDRILSAITDAIDAPLAQDTPSLWTTQSVWIKSLVVSGVIAGTAGLYKWRSAGSPRPASAPIAEVAPPERVKPAHPPSTQSLSPAQIRSTPPLVDPISAASLQSLAPPEPRTQSIETVAARPPQRRTALRRRRRNMTSARSGAPRSTRPAPLPEPPIKAPSTQVASAAPPPPPEPPIKLDAPAARDLALREERRLLSAAMQAVRSRAFTRAQQTLDTYARRFPDGQLAPESRLVQIRLYLANQQPEAARAAARAFLKRHPNSGLRRTIERLLK